MSIKLRVTLWYTLLLVIIMALVIGFMLIVSQSVVEGNAGSRLKTIVHDNIEEVEYDDGKLDVDDDDLIYFKDGVYSVLYDESFVQVGGNLPSAFTGEPAFAEGVVQTLTAGGQRWMIYDRQVTFKKHAPVWVRGILSLDAVSGVIGTMLTIAFIAFPLLILLAALGGYGITKRAFMPVRAINRTVESIQEGKDLSRRIALGKGNDEIHELANTYNRMLKRLEDSFEAEKQFASDVSHELRTPISVILAQCEYAVGANAMDEDGRDTLAVIQRQANRMSRLISYLLTMTRLQQGTEKAEFEDVDLSGLIQTLFDEQAVLKAGAIVLQSEIEPNIQARVDIVLMTRLFHNLVQNAFQYSRPNGTVRIALAKQNGFIVLSVSDDGIGISEEEQSKIWQRFYQVNPSRTAKESGSMGLGLAMVQQIASLHCGEVQVQSVYGDGATFTFQFPSK